MSQFSHKEHPRQKMNVIAVRLFVLACIVMCIPDTDAAVMCYKCDHVAHPRDCDRVVQCSNNEVCSVTKYAQADGNTYYDTGCLSIDICSGQLGLNTIGKKSDATVCKKCCTGKYCNKELCDVPSQKSHGPRCLQCTTVEHPSDCGAVVECNTGENCFTLEKYVFGERRYQLGCSTNGCAQRLRRNMLQKRENVCHECCTEENCNRELCPMTGAEAASTTPRTFNTISLSPINATLKFGETTPATLTGCHYKGHVYYEGESWNHGCQYQCTCMDNANGKYACKDLCLKYLNVPNECKMVVPDGECCPKPDCSGTNIHMTNFSTVNITGYIGLHDCQYEGQHYRQNETWRDSCEWECTCVDSNRGYYKCHSLCYSWDLPAVCHLEPAAPGKCCKTPSCPAGYKINYPSGYIVN